MLRELVNLSLRQIPGLNTDFNETPDTPKQGPKEASRLTYEALPGNDYIRIATLYPGKDDDKIIIALDPVKFDHDEPPQYEALSYTWGSKENPKPISIKTPKMLKLDIVSIFHVTQNLFEALQHLRYSDKPRTLWIDAICIDQMNNEEKSVQIIKMGELFRKASRVVAWLGPRDMDSDHGMVCMRRLGSQFSVADWELFSLARADPPTLPDQDDVVELCSQDVEAILHLLCRGLFDRLWIRQEILLANEQAIVQCGLQQAPWNTLRTAMVALAKIRIVPWCEAFVQLDDRIAVLKGLIYHSSRLDLRGLHPTVMDTLCEDPRDRIYAVLDLLRDDNKAIGIKPDYSKTVTQVYQHVMMRYLQHHKSLNLLMQCQYAQGHDGPSWVPDWALKQGVGIDYGFASPHTLPWYQLSVGDDILRVVAVGPAEKITQIQRLDVRRVKFVNDIIEELRSLLLENTAFEHAQGKSRFEAYCIALLCGQYADTFEPPNSAIPTRKEADEIMALIASESYTFKDEDFDWETPGDKFVTAVDSQASMSGATFLTTSSGHVALGPPTTQAGDEVRVLLGCDSPMVLRRAPGQSGFLVVGSCYIPELASGEALFGPLPGDTEVVYVFDQRVGEYLMRFRDQQTGRISHADPRLVSMVAGIPELEMELEESEKSNQHGRKFLPCEFFKGKGMTEEIDLL